MVRRKENLPLSVYLNGRFVGILRREKSGAIDFQYDKVWLQWEHAIPVSLSLPLREERFIGAPVIAVFDNLLPDNDQIRRRLAERVHAEGNDAYSLLTAVGRDCVGALQFLPDGADPGRPGELSGRQLEIDEIVRTLDELKTAPLGVDEGNEFRISLAGAQEKTALLYWKKNWYLPHGTTATTHIFKPQIGILPSGIDLSQSVENENLCMRMTDSLGLPTAKTEIHDFGGKRVLVVERFDRLWTRDKRLLRLPQEDCCQALSVPPTRKYEADGGPGILDIMELLKASDEPSSDQRVFLKAQIVFWLLGATDGHAKNFSLLIMPGGRFRLAPLYDVMSAQPNVDAGQIQINKMKLAMAVGTNRHYAINSIAARHFAQTAEACGSPKALVASIIGELSELVPTAIEKVGAELPFNFPQKLRDSIFAGVTDRLKRLLLAPI